MRFNLKQDEINKIVKDHLLKYNPHLDGQAFSFKWVRRHKTGVEVEVNADFLDIPGLSPDVKIEMYNDSEEFYSESEKWDNRELGASEEHAVRASPEDEKALEEATTGFIQTEEETQPVKSLFG